MVETRTAECRGVVTGTAGLLGGNMGRGHYGCCTLATTGMAGRTLGRRSLEHAANVAGFAAYVMVCTAQRKPRLDVIEAGVTGWRRRGIHCKQGQQGSKKNGQQRSSQSVGIRGKGDQAHRDAPEDAIR